jgi:hypothetical protein
MRRKIFTLIIFAGLFSNCKKYEDGPLISLRSPIKRIYGTYSLYKYEVNGTDSLSLFKDSLFNVLKFFYDENTNTDGCTINGVRIDGKTSCLVWTWKLEKNNTTLRVVYSSCLTGLGITSWPSGTGPFSDKVKPEWKILRLTNSELKMNTNYNGKEYLIDLR